MFMQIADRLTRFARLLPHASLERDEHADEELPQSGWHESSWALTRGVDVIELSAAAAATLFPDTQPATYYDPIGEMEPLAA
jgi:hypothetical protein